MSTQKVSLLTEKSRESFIKLLHIDASKGCKVVAPFIFLSVEKTRYLERLLVVLIQFDEYGVKTEFQKLKGNLIAHYMELPKTLILVDDSVLGPKSEIYLTEAFKNNPDDIAVGVEFKNGILWAWMPKEFLSSP